mgnify:FL=1
MNETLSISDTSEVTGFSQRQLRNYEARGYINPTQKIRCGKIQYRRYSPENIENIKSFKSYLDQGFTLKAASRLTKENTEKGGE